MLENGERKHLLYHRKCNTCGKKISMLMPEQWGYKVSNNSRTDALFFCTYKCMRVWEKANIEKKKNKAMTSPGRANGQSHKSRWKEWRTNIETAYERLQYMIQKEHECSTLFESKKENGEFTIQDRTERNRISARRTMYRNKIREAQDVIEILKGNKECIEDY